MQVLVSVPGSALKRRWNGAVVDGDLAADLIDDPAIVKTIDVLSFHLSGLGIATKIVIRPEIFSSGPALAHIQKAVPDLCGHIFVGPPHRVKYLKGTRNLACFAPIGSTTEADEIRREFSYNPRRLQNMQACLNGFATAALLGDHRLISHPILLPKKSVVSQSSERPSRRRALDDALVTSLFLNNFDSNNSARAMTSRLKPLTEYLASRPGILNGAPVFLATIASQSDLLTGIAPALRDFAYLSLTGASATVIVLVEDASSLTIEVLEGVAERLNRSLQAAGFHQSLIDSDAIIIAPALNPIEGLLRLTNYVLLFDFDWTESEINQRALRSGSKPMLLANAHPTIRNMYLKTALVVPEENRHLRPSALGTAMPFGYPATGSLQKIVARALTDHSLLKNRVAMSEHAISVFRDALARLKAAFEWNEAYEIRFG